MRDSAPPDSTAYEWVHHPGEPGINYEARQYLASMPHNDPDHQWSCNNDGQRQPYQENLRALTEPKTPFKRLLVVWSMGMGKTRSIVDVLDNYYNDPRPKIFLAPNRSLANNFYKELLDKRYDNRYQAWVEENRGTHPVCSQQQRPTTTTASQHARDVDMLECRRRFQEVRRMPGDIRALTYKQLGKAPAEAPQDGTYHQAHAVLWSSDAIRQRQNGSNGVVLRGLDACIIVVDEAHLLTEPRHARLCELLTQAANSVIVMFTGTPVMTPRSSTMLGSLDRLLGIVAGRSPDTVIEGMKHGTHSYEGYVSYFTDRGMPALFARTSPPLIALPRVCVVHMPKSYADRYAKERFRGVPKGSLTCLGSEHKRVCNPVREGLSSTWLEHKNRNERQKIRQLGEDIPPDNTGVIDNCDGRMHAPKLAQVVHDIRSRNRSQQHEKTVIMIHRRNGLYTLERLLGLAKLKYVILWPQTSSKIGRENDQKIRLFNDKKNAMGSEVQVLVANEEHNEGLSIFDARRIILVDQTDNNMASTLALLRQRLARALRMCSHTRLEPAKRTLAMDLYVLDWDVGSKRMVPTIDMEKYLQLKRQHETEDLTEERYLYYISIDGELYTPYAPGDEQQPNGERGAAHLFRDLRRDIDRLRYGPQLATGRRVVRKRPRTSAVAEQMAQPAAAA